MRVKLLLIFLELYSTMAFLRKGERPFFQFALLSIHQDCLPTRHLFTFSPNANIGESNGESITALLEETPKLVLKKREADALKVSLSPGINERPEEFRKINRLIFDNIDNVSTEDVMKPYCRAAGVLEKIGENEVFLEKGVVNIPK
jgi:hypothetical protein